MLSTFDFQNLVKIEFNPPQLAEISEIIPESVNAQGDMLNSRADRLLSKAKNISEKALHLSLQKIYMRTF